MNATRLRLMMWFCLVAATATAQSEEEIARFLAAGKNDASKLITAYAKPVVKSLSYGMTGGWYNTAKTHKSLGFDFGFTINMAYIPTAENFFNPNALGLESNYTFTNNTRPGVEKAPTVVGPGDDTEYTISGDLDGDPQTPDNSITLPGPEGFDLKKNLKVGGVPVPMLQVGIGIIKNTDLKFRLVPKQKFGESEIQMLGFGLMHDIKQHIKGIKLLPFDLSILAAFNTVSGVSDMRNDPTSDVYTQDGELKYRFNSYLFQALVSKKVAVLTVYGGAGYTFVKTNVDLNGTWMVNASPTFDVTNPVSIDFKSKSLRLTAGMRLKLGPLYFVGDYTVQEYNTLSVGMGFAFR